MKINELPKHYVQYEDIVKYNPSFDPIMIHEILNDIITKYPGAINFSMRVSKDVFNKIENPDTYLGIKVTCLKRSDLVLSKSNWFEIYFQYPTIARSSAEIQAETHTLERTSWWMFWRKYK